MIGAGKYDDLCTLVRERTNADGVVLIVVGGNRGEGASVQVVQGLHESVPDMLRRVANQMDSDLFAMNKGEINA